MKPKALFAFPLFSVYFLSVATDCLGYLYIIAKLAAAKVDTEITFFVAAAGCWV